MNNHMADLTKTTNMVEDLAALGAATSQLGNLSRYADQAAHAAMAGTVAAAELHTFLRSARSFYAQIRTDVLAAMKDDHRAGIDLGMPDLTEVHDVYATALVLDQALVWLSAKVLPSNFERQLRLSAMKMEMEEKMTTEEFGKLGTPRPGGLYA